MRTKNFVILLVVALSGACAGKHTPATPGVPKAAEVTETAEARLARLGETLSEEERRVLQLATAIEDVENWKKEQKEAEKNDLPSMKEARKLIRESQEREDKRQRQVYEAKMRANVTGCEIDLVTVKPEVVEKDMFKLGAVVKVTIDNQNPFPVDIEVPTRVSGTAVTNLCANGSLTLSFVSGFFESQTEEVTLRAIARPADGEMFVRDFRIYLNLNDINYRRVRTESWTLRRQ